MDFSEFDKCQRDQFIDKYCEKCYKIINLEDVDPIQCKYFKEAFEELHCEYFEDDGDL